LSWLRPLTPFLAQERTVIRLASLYGILALYQWRAFIREAGCGKTQKAIRRVSNDEFAMNMKPIYESRETRYEIDRCEPQNNAIRTGSIAFHALSKGHYPGMYSDFMSPLSISQPKIQ
jgi:hypothetical protein